MTKTLWAIEAYRFGEWILLPNTVMPGRENVEFDLSELRKEEPVEELRLVSYERVMK